MSTTTTTAKRGRGRPLLDPDGGKLRLLGVKIPQRTMQALKHDAQRRGKKPGTLAREILTMWVDMMPRDEGGYVR